MSQRACFTLLALVLATSIAAQDLGRPQSDAATGWPLVFASGTGDGGWTAACDGLDPRAWRPSPTGDLELYRASEGEPSVRSPRSLAWLRHPVVGDFVFELEVRSMGADIPHRDVCVAFGRTSADRFAYVHLAQGADDHAHGLFLVDGAPRRKVAAAATQGFAFGSTETWHAVRLERRLAGVSRLLVDGMPVLETPLRCLGVGELGFGSFDDTAAFRNLRLFAPPPDPSFAVRSSTDECRRLEILGRPAFGRVGSARAIPGSITARAFDHLYAPNSGIRITNGVTGELYPHHRGVMIGWSKTTVEEQTTDFWHLNDATIEHTRWEDGTTDATLGRKVRSVAVWRDARGAIVLEETRTVDSVDLEDGMRRFDYRVTLRNMRAAPLRLSGDPQHAGLQIRLADEVARSKAQTRYVRSAGAKDLGKDVWEGTDWVAGRFTVEGRVLWVIHRVGANVPRPLVYSTRDYGRFGAYFATELPAGATLPLDFQLLIVERELDDSALPALVASRF